MESTLQMKGLTLTYGTYRFEIMVDNIEYDKLMNDQNYADQYSRMLIEQMGMRTELGVPPEAVRDDPSTGASGSLPSPSPSSEESAASCNFVGENSNDFKWTRQTTLLLITTRGGMRGEFEGAFRKKKLWHKVAEIINTTAGTTLSGDICDMKWRNLLSRYRKKKDQEKNTGESSVQWEYFNDMDKYLHNKACSAPPLERLQASMDSQVASPSVGVAETSMDSSLNDHAKRKVQEPVIRTKVMKTAEEPLWFHKYSVRQEEERKKDREEMQRRWEAQQEQQARRWEQQKQLDQQRLEAFTNFTSLLQKIIEKD